MTKRLFAFIATLITLVVLGATLGYLYLYPDQEDSIGKEVATPKEREILYWVAPMDKNFRRDGPGKSPMGMDLVPVYADDGDEDAVSISPSVVQNLGIKTERVKFGPLARTVDAVGYVTYAEDAIEHIHSRVEGWVQSLNVKTQGDPVTKGQILLEIYSPTLVNAQLEYISALKSNQSSLAEASEQRLLALGMSSTEIAQVADDRQVREHVEILAPRDGVSIELNVRQGIFVTPATHMVSTAAPDQLWVIAEIYERQADWIYLGQTATLTFESLPGQVLEGEVTYIYPTLDKFSRSLEVRINIKEVPATLKPNMFAKVRLQAEPSKSLVHVPRGAVIRSSHGDRVVIETRDGGYKSVAVSTGIESGERVGIVKGLTRRAKVVTSGQFLIDSESNAAAALARFDEN